MHEDPDAWTAQGRLTRRTAHGHDANQALLEILQRLKLPTNDEVSAHSALLGAQVENGRVVDMIPNAQLEANMGKLHEYLGV